MSDRIVNCFGVRNRETQPTVEGQHGEQLHPQTRTVERLTAMAETLGDTAVEPEDHPGASEVR